MPALCCHCARVFLAHIAEWAEDDRFPLTPQQIVHDVRRVMPEDGIVWRRMTSWIQVLLEVQPIIEAHCGGYGIGLAHARNMIHRLNG